MANLTLNSKQAAVFEYLFSKYQDLAKPAQAAYGEIQVYMAGAAKDLGIDIEKHTFNSDTMTFEPIPDAPANAAPHLTVVPPQETETTPHLLGADDPIVQSSNGPVSESTV